MPLYGEIWQNVIDGKNQEGKTYSKWPASRKVYVYIKNLTLGGKMSVRDMYMTIIFKQLLQNCLANQSQITFGALQGQGKESLFGVYEGVSKSLCTNAISF